MIRNGMMAMIAATLASVASIGCAHPPLPLAQTATGAEREACRGVPDAEREAGPFTRRDLVARVEELQQPVSPKAPAPPAGIAVYLRATPGVTEPWLGRVVACYRLHHAASGATVAPDPLTIDGTRVGVSSTATAFRIAITADDVAIARSVVAAGRTLSAN